MAGVFNIEYVGRAVKSRSFDVATSGSVRTVTAAVAFDSTWADFPTKTAIFASGATVKQVLLDAQNTCVVPWEVLERDGNLEIGVVGQNGGRIMPSVKTVVRIFEGIYTEGAVPGDPSPDIYEQIVQIMQETLSVAQSVRSDADAGKFNGRDGLDGKDGRDGEDYVLTEDDKVEIVDAVLEALPAAEDYAFGN